MSDKQLIIELPEDLLEQANAAHIDLRAVLERALLVELAQRQPKLSLAEKHQRLRDLLPPERVNEALRDLEEDKRILGLSEGQIIVSNDFDEPLPDEFWGDLFK